MIPTVYLYNLDNPRGAKIRRMCLPLGIRTLLVVPRAHMLTLEEMMDDTQPLPDGEPGFSDEMLLLVGFTDAKMDALFMGFRRAKIPSVALKAVLTETNRSWTSVQLHQELLREREAIQQGNRVEHKE